MISQQFERLILANNCEAKTINVNNGVFNFHVGKGKKIIVENLHFHNVVSEFLIFGFALEDLIKTLEELQNNLFFTINIYDDITEKNLTIKNNYQINYVLGGQGLEFISTIQSNLSFAKDLFWVFNGENLTIEITSSLDLLTNLTQIIQPYNLNSKRTENPNGFQLPNATFINYNGGTFEFNSRLMGSQTRNLVLNANPTIDGLIIPRFGDGATGNALNAVSGNPFASPLLNVGLLILSEDCQL